MFNLLSVKNENHAWQNKAKKVPNKILFLKSSNPSDPALIQLRCPTPPKNKGAVCQRCVTCFLHSKLVLWNLVTFIMRRCANGVPYNHTKQRHNVEWCAGGSYEYSSTFVHKWHVGETHLKMALGLRKAIG